MPSFGVESCLALPCKENLQRSRTTYRKTRSIGTPIGDRRKNLLISRETFSLALHSHVHMDRGIHQKGEENADPKSTETDKRKSASKIPTRTDSKIFRPREETCRMRTKDSNTSQGRSNQARTSPAPGQHKCVLHRYWLPTGIRIAMRPTDKIRLRIACSQNPDPSKGRQW